MTWRRWIRAGFSPMPELPEVETIRLTLYDRVLGRTVQNVQILHPGVIRHPDAARFAAQLTGSRIAHLRRRGKFLLFDLEQDRLLLVHLRMTGRLLYVAPGSQPPLVRHTHLILDLDDGAALRYEDVRRFGGFYLLDADRQGAPPGFLTLGPEPLEILPKAFAQRLASRPKSGVKAVLLDQRVLAGMGNIYADEALFTAGINPETPVQALGPKAMAQLHQAVVEVLRAGLQDRGTSFDRYLDGDGQPGQHAAYLQVYGRTGKSCPRCGGLIVKRRVAGRGTHLCPHCQRDKKSKGGGRS